MDPQEFQQIFDVSRETMQKMQVYHDLLVKWQKSINLVSSRTLKEAWGRHFADSAQLAALIPGKAKQLLDLGSGAGFPGLVLAILRPDIEIHLAESDERKAQFLRTVSRETSTAVTIHNQRLEALGSDVKPDIVTARALAPLAELLDCCGGWAAENRDLIMVFPKGREAAKEIAVARERHNFTVKSSPSCTDPAGEVLCISLLMPKS
jgi:16S rRNA (guanine527-N7)-methyltransferase